MSQQRGHAFIADSDLQSQFLSLGFHSKQKWIRTLRTHFRLLITSYMRSILTFSLLITSLTLSQVIHRDMMATGLEVLIGVIPRKVGHIVLGIYHI